VNGYEINIYKNLRLSPRWLASRIEVEEYFSRDLPYSAGMRRFGSQDMDCQVGSVDSMLAIDDGEIEVPSLFIKCEFCRTIRQRFDFCSIDVNKDV
jgi:hypothetical protein